MFDPFEMPQIPRSLADWLLSLCQHFWNQHRRCLAAVLLLDSQTHGWGTAIPTQRCSRDASCWSTRRENVDGLLPTHLLAGSFQCRIISPGEELADAVPPVDGVHLVLQLTPQKNVLAMFIRMNGIVQAASADRVFLDDWENMLRRVESRLTLI